MKDKNIWWLIFPLLLLAACMKDDGNPYAPLPRPQSGTKGVFIMNQGNFMYENASLSFYDAKSRMLYNNVFLGANGVAPGDVLQSMTIRDTLGYLVMNNSGKLHIINLNNLKIVGKITGFTSPRYLHFVDEKKAYVSDLYARRIWVVDTESREITGFVDLSENPSLGNGHSSGMMVRYEKFVFTNSWSYDDKILVIDTETDELVDSIPVIFQPAAIVLDKNNKLWVLSDGGYQGNPFGYERPGLTRIDAATRQTEEVIYFDQDDFPQKMTINMQGDTLYFINRHVFRLAVDAATLPEMFIQSPYSGNIGGFYGLAVDPQTSDVYVADAIDNVQPGLVFRYSPAGIATDTLRVGIIPGNFCFWVE
jgi:DNA-binding beta-propeller fold protein YncE